MHITLHLNVLGVDLGHLRIDLDVPDDVPEKTPQPVRKAVKWLSDKWVRGMLA